MASTLHRDYLAEHLLPLIGQNSARLPNREITGFLSMAGKHYNHELMVVGRAVNRWGKGKYFPRELSDVATSQVFAEAIFKSVTDDKACPMAWVTEGWGSSDEYNTKRSAFWRTIRAVVAKAGIVNADDEAWPSHLVWSNLYKLAPEEGGNPGAALRRGQLSGCLELFRQEIEIYRPRRLLLLTGLDWAEPFLDRFVPSITRTSSKFVKAVAQIEHSSGKLTSVVVAVHPQGKPEITLVAEIFEAFESIEHHRKFC